jgi:hypothetical protein
VFKFESYQLNIDALQIYCIVFGNYKMIVKISFKIRTSSLFNLSHYAPISEQSAKLHQENFIVRISYVPVSVKKQQIRVTCFGMVLHCIS